MKAITTIGRILIAFFVVCSVLAVAVAQVRAGYPSANNALVCDHEVSPGEGSPFQAAINTATSGQTICVHGGIYHEIVKVPTGKTNLTLIAYPGESPVIDGQKVLPGGLPADRFLALVELNAVGTILDGFEVRFSAARGVDVTANNIIVRNSSVHDNWSTGINLRGPLDSDKITGVLIENNSVYRNMRRAQNIPVIYRATRSGSGPTDWVFDPNTNWDNPFWSGVDKDLPEQSLNDIAMTFDTDGLTSRIYAGSPRSGRVGYIGADHSKNGQQFSYSGADLLFHEPAFNKWTLFLDGDKPANGNSPAIGIPSNGVIDAFQIESTEPISTPWPCSACAPILMSFAQTLTIPIDEGNVITPTITPTAIGPSDLVTFSPTAVDEHSGRIIAGAFTIYKRAADLSGLPPAANIDALDRAPDGRLLMSFTATQTLANPDGSNLVVQKEDLVAYNENGVDQVWELFFNGNDIRFNPFNAENLTAAWLDSAGNIYISGNPIGGSALTLINTLNSTARGNTVYNNYGEGLVSDRFSDGALLEGNTVYDNLHANLYLNSTTNPLVRGNLVYCTDDRHFWSKGSTRTYRPSPGIQIRDENFETVVPPPSSGQVIINNIVIGCGSNFGVSTQTTGGGLNQGLVANNVFANARGDKISGVANGVNNIELNISATYANSRFINNLILQSDPSGEILRVQGTPPNGSNPFATFTVANNLYSVAPPLSWFSGEPGRVVGNPQLAVALPPVPVMGQVPDPNDYRLTYASPALDAGQALSEVTSDFTGLSRAGAGPLDIGAFELPHTGRIIVVQESFPAGSTQAFDFTASFTPANFSLIGGQQQPSGTLQAGTYSVGSAPVADWTTTAACSDGSPATAIVLAANETVTCTFTSVRETRLIVDNSILPAGDPQQFTFTRTPGDAFQLGNASQTFVVDPGTYSVAATVPEGWEQTGAICDNGGAPAAVALAAGDWVTCTFTHRKLGRIIVEKRTQPAAAAQPFGFTAGYGSFELRDGERNTSAYLAPGTYAVTETPVAGWSPVEVTCDDGSQPGAIELSAGETVTCVFTSARLALSISKTPTPAAVTAPGGDVSFGVQITNSGSAAVTLAALSDSVFGNVAESGNAALLATTCALPRLIEPGAGYACAFNARVSGTAGGVHTNTLTVTGTGPGNSPVSASVSATVDILTPPPGRIIVSKQTVPANTAGTFQFTATYGTFSLRHGQSHDSGLLPSGVTYSVTEAPLDGWAISTAVCVGDDDGANPAAIVLDPGETVTCTFTNSRTTTGPLATFYVTTPKAGSVRGLVYSPGDILAYNNATNVWSLYFDASVFGITKALNDFVLLHDGSILMAFKDRVKPLDAAGNIITIEPQDIARFIPAQTGNTTSGRFEMYFDGSDVALSTAGEKIDALAMRPDGLLLISTSGAAAVKNGSTALKAADEDLLAFRWSSLGAVTAGTWSLLPDGFDGSRLAGMAAENVTAAFRDAANGNLYLALATNFKVTGISGTSKSVLSVTPAGIVTIYWDAATAGFPGPVDGLHIQMMN